MVTLADEFRGFRDRFRAIHSLEASDADRVIWEIAVPAAKAFKRGVDAGRITGCEEWKIWPDAPPQLTHEDSVGWKMVWIVAASAISRELPGRVSRNPLALRLIDRSGPGTARVVAGESFSQDWILRRERFADVCDCIADWLDGTGGEKSAASVPDGFAPPCDFVWNGKKSSTIGPTVWNLGRYLYAHPTASFQALIDEVWDGREVGNSAITTAISRLNSVFFEMSCPWSASSRNRYAQLDRPQPR